MPYTRNICNRAFSVLIKKDVLTLNNSKNNKVYIKFINQQEYGILTKSFEFGNYKVLQKRENLLLFADNLILSIPPFKPIN